MIEKLGTGLIELSMAGATQASAALGVLKSGLMTMKDAASGVSLHAKIGFAALTASIGLAVKESADAESTFARLQSVIAAGGSSIGFSAEALRDYAGALAESSRFSQGAIMEAEIVLAAFQKIRGPIMTGAIDVLADMAVVMKTDVADSARLLGKALSDPADAIQMLTKAQVTWTDAEEKTLNRLIASKKMMEAQQFILEKLRGTYGGAAAKDITTFGGSLVRMKNQLADVYQAIGDSLLPYMKSFVSTLSTGVPKITAFVAAHGDWVVKTLAVAGGTLGLLAILPKFLTTLSQVGKVAAFLLSPFSLLVAAIGVVGYSLAVANSSTGSFVDGVTNLAAQVGTAMDYLLTHIFGLKGGWAEAMENLESGLIHFGATAKFVAAQVTTDFATLMNSIRVMSTKMLTDMSIGLAMSDPKQVQKITEGDDFKQWAAKQKDLFGNQKKKFTTADIGQFMREKAEAEGVIKPDDYGKAAGGKKSWETSLQETMAQWQKQAASEIFPGGEAETGITDWISKMKEKVKEVAGEVRKAWNGEGPDAGNLDPNKFGAPEMPKGDKKDVKTSSLEDVAKNIQIAAFRGGKQGDPAERAAQAAEKQNVLQQNAIDWQKITADRIEKLRNFNQQPATAG